MMTLGCASIALSSSQRRRPIILEILCAHSKVKGCRPCARRSMNSPVCPIIKARHAGVPNCSDSGIMRTFDDRSLIALISSSSVISGRSCHLIAIA